ncbi:heavy metal-associated domain-containing protein [Rhodococcus sp. IEGM 1330]|uniref:heavy-metal-associated domain-containing protein n=1 Tax=Rhodococcus sp. IEGM 1330 TaxID=3082225 RepID=UPI00295401AB|nr:heavy metal-associated domain-containing protein [Rhodococcus sp. IEGM 1330]MDV8023514.1 heavy metal-associated domain-containing protein [Rhodococcus sp. IEGM 1330]
MELFTSTYRVTGMTCGHCEASITEEVGELAEVESVVASAAEGTLTVVGTPALQQTDVIAAVRQAGYSATADPSISHHS